MFIMEGKSWRISRSRRAQPRAQASEQEKDWRVREDSTRDMVSS